MRAVEIGVIVVVIGALIAGFIAIGSPADSRARRFDQQRITALSTIQWQIVSYWQTKGALPKTLDDLNDDISGFRVPTDPDTGKQFEYQSSGAYTFSLCAIFSRAGGTIEKGRYPPFRMPMMMPIKPVPYHDGGSFVSESWQHEAGLACFERIVDQDFYRPAQSLRPSVQEKSCLFDEKKLRVGDSVCGMSITSMTSSKKGTEIVFNGLKSLKVFYYPGEHAGGMEVVELRKESRYQLPYQENDNTMTENKEGNLYSQSGDIYDQKKNEKSFGSFSITNEENEEGENGIEGDFQAWYATMSIDSYVYNDNQSDLTALTSEAASSREPVFDLPSAYTLHVLSMANDLFEK